MTRTRKWKEADLKNNPSAEELRSHISVLERKKLAVLSTQKFMPFVKYTQPDPEDPMDPHASLYKNARHHDAIARVLEEVEKGEIKQLILTMPPRHGKSELTTRRFPAWYLGRNPTRQIVVATYSDTFAEDFGRDVRRIIQSPEYKHAFPEIRTVRGSNAADRMQTVQGGGIRFVGRGGALTGRGAHLMIIDDLMKDAQEAASQAIRDQAWEWFTKVAMTRRMGDKLVVIVMTRWHSDDIVGRLTDPENSFYSSQEAANWKIINLPAIAEDDDPLGRKPGEALWPDGPDKFDLGFLAQQQRLDPLGFSALYQQRPSAVDGTLFKREYIRYYDRSRLPDNLRIYTASDHAVSTQARRDFSVFLTVGVDTQGNIYLLDCFRERAAADRQVEVMLNMAHLRPPLVWWAERGHISKSIGPFLRRRMVERGVFFPLQEVTPVNDKATRAQSIAARMALGYVWFPKDAPWVEPAIDELMRFPNGTHDDFVDAFSLIGLGLGALHNAAPREQRRKAPKYGTLGWVKQHNDLADYEAALNYRGGY